MQTFLDTLDQLGIFAELNPDDPQKIRQRFEQHIHDGQLTYREGVMGTYFVKFYNEPIEFRVKPGVFLYDVETGISHNLDAE